MLPSAFSIPFFNRFLGGVRATEARVSVDGVALGALFIAHSSRGTWKQRACFFWRRLELVGEDEARARFILRTRDAESFLSLSNGCRTRHSHRDLLERAASHVTKWKGMVEASRYLPRHEVEVWARDAAPVGEALFPYLRELASTSVECPSICLTRLLRDPFGAANERNKAFVAHEQARLAKWFASFEPPPTDTQCEVAIRDETNSLVVAGAGTGKTSAIIAKIRYLLHAGIASPEKILVLAFNTDAAQEIRDRCSGNGGEALTVLTFHALGLQILGEGPGEKPPVLSELSTDASRAALIEKLIAELIDDKAYAENFARFVYLYSRPLVDRFGSNSESQFVSRSKSAITVSLSGHWVRSSEELRIADWLFAHGITFDYEGTYPFDTSGADKKQYRPDFTIRFTKVGENSSPTDVNVYLEHQALNKRGDAPKWMLGYREKVEWIRATHRRHGTIVIESFSWWFHNGVWEHELKAVLMKAGVPVPEVDWRARLTDAMQSKSQRFAADRRSVIQLMTRTLDLVRCTATVPGVAFTVSSGATSRTTPDSKLDASREALFDQIVHPLERAYESYKKRREGIDFEDMIFLARQVVDAGSFKAPWSHYIVDEFQDASLSRLELVQSLRKQRPDSRLTCIGDDWQAIIRFAGGDVRVMTQFGQRVGPFWQANLGQTFRYSPIIAEVSSEFVVTNPDQLKKRISPAPGSMNLPIRIILSAPTTDEPDSRGDARFNDILFSELDLIRKFKPDASILLLSRYRRGIPELAEQNSIREAFPGLTLIWSTVHRSKGREADAVVVGDLDDHAFGFPCLREDDPIIRKYLPPEDSFEHAEERRLFYVAMTRAKHRLTLVANGLAPSPFVTEIITQRGGRPGLEIVRSGDPAKVCPRCRAGYIIGRDGTNGRFYACTKSPACSHTEQACPLCRRGFLVPNGDRMVCSMKETRGCTHDVRTCPRCKTGWLVIRENRQNKRKFWGCSRFSDDEAQCRYTER
jgi:DNA helicase-4